MRARGQIHMGRWPPISAELPLTGHQSRATPLVEPPGAESSHSVNGRIRVEQLVWVDTMANQEGVEPRSVLVDIEILRRPFEALFERRRNRGGSGAVAHRVEAPFGKVEAQ